MAPSDFIYSNNFPALTTDQVQGGIDAVETAWYGALLLWNALPEVIRTKKRTLLENLLVAWYLSDLYPGLVVGVVSNGGLPLTSKSIGGVSVSMKDIATQPGLEALTSNTFGLQAFMMIEGAGEMYAVYG